MTKKVEFQEEQKQEPSQSRSSSSSELSFELTEAELQRVKREIQQENEQEYALNQESEDLLRDVVFEGIRQHQTMGRQMDMMNDFQTKIEFLQGKVAELQAVSEGKFS